jgi:hypothetical protein
MPHVRRPKRFAFLTLLFTCSISWLVIPQHPAGRHLSPTKDATAGPPETFSAPKAGGNSAKVLPTAREELDKPRRALVSEAYGRLPLSFEVNTGRFDEKVKYVSRGSGYALFLTPTEAVLTLHPAAVPLSSNVGYLPATHDTEAAVLRMKCVGADPEVRPEGVDEQPGKSNYFIGNDPAKWRTNVASYGGVRYRRIYPGVNLVYHGSQRQLEYDFEVAPGADPAAIRLTFGGAREVSLDPTGDLVLGLPGGGEVRQHRPVVYQEMGGRKEEVAGRYVLKGRGEVGFEVAEYDSSRPLVIDPVLSYSSYLGGSRTEQGHGIAVDSFGNAYVVGYTESQDFPTVNSRVPGTDFNDAFVTKINPSGSAMVYSTYLGGNSNDGGFGVAVDSSGNAYVTGFTSSPNFPTEHPVSGRAGGTSADAFITKLSPEGSTLVYSTYLGGNARDEGHGIAVDSAGNAYVAGETSSTNFPVTAGAFQTAISEPNNAPFIPEADAFVTKLNPSGTALVYSTYLGGSFSSELVGGVAVGADGSAYVAGNSGSATFPVLDSLQPRPADGGAVFISKLNPSGAGLIYSTYLGGDNYEIATGLALDSAGNAYLTGWTLGGFPVMNAFQPTIGGGGNSLPDAFVAKIGNAPIQPPTVLAIDAVTPSRGGNSGSVTVSLYGSGFKNGATVKLTRAGQPDIDAASVGVSEDSFITRARFDLVGHAPGLCDVVLTNPDGRSATRAAAFNVAEGGHPDFWVDIVGSDSFRPGRPQTYFVTFGNRGTVDAALVPIFVAMPKEAEYELDFNLHEPPQPIAGQHFDFSQIPTYFQTETEKIG